MIQKSNCCFNNNQYNFYLKALPWHNIMAKFDLQDPLLVLKGDFISMNHWDGPSDCKNQCPIHDTEDSSLLKRYRKCGLHVNALFSNGTFNNICKQPTFIRLIPCSAQRASTNLTYIGSSQLLAKMHKWAWRLQLDG